MTKPDREASVTASIPLSVPEPDVPAEPGSPTAEAELAERERAEEEAEANFWSWCEVDRARKVAAIVTDYHSQFVPALARGLRAADAAAIPPEQIAEQMSRVFQHILAALAGEQDPVKLGIEHSRETIGRVHVAITSPPGGLSR